MLLLVLFVANVLFIANAGKNGLAVEHGKRLLQTKFLELFRNVLLNKHYNDHNGIFDGREWPPGAQAFSMAGMRRIDHFSAIVAHVIFLEIPGHVIETGVWRGGASFMAAKTIELLSPKHTMLTYLCDSFKGIPKTDKKCEFFCWLRFPAFLSRLTTLYSFFPDI